MHFKNITALLLFSRFVFMWLRLITNLLPTPCTMMQTTARYAHENLECRACQCQCKCQCQFDVKTMLISMSFKSQCKKVKFLKNALRSITALLLFSRFVFI